MIVRRLLWFIFIACIPAAFVAGYYAWQGYNRATVIVEWTTASELDMAGFNLYRSETQSGPFEKVNQGLIPGSSDPLTGGSYTYEDNNVKPGVTYYYELEDVAVSGGTGRFGPIEVTATGGGRNEAVLTLALLVVGIAGIMSLRSRPTEGQT